MASADTYELFRENTTKVARLPFAGTDAVIVPFGRRFSLLVRSGRWGKEGQHDGEIREHEKASVGTGHSVERVQIRSCSYHLNFSIFWKHRNRGKRLHRM